MSKKFLNAEGLGSPTKAYFWINAFIREFIATIHTQRKKHLKVIAVLTLLIIVSVTAVFISDTL